VGLQGGAEQLVGGETGSSGETTAGTSGAPVLERQKEEEGGRLVF